MGPDDVLHQKGSSVLSRGKFSEGNKVNSLGESIHNGEDSGEGVGQGKTSDEIKSNVRPRAARDREGLKKTRGRRVGYLVSGAD